MYTIMHVKHLYEFVIKGCQQNINMLYHAYDGINSLFVSQIKKNMLPCCRVQVHVQGFHLTSRRLPEFYWLVDHMWTVSLVTGISS